MLVCGPREARELHTFSQKKRELHTGGPITFLRVVLVAGPVSRLAETSGTCLGQQLQHG
jgi:hypothetical protein